MITLILILILLAILYSTHQGRELLSELFSLPFKIIAFPFNFIADVKRGYKEEREEAKKLAEKETLKKSFKDSDLDLIQEKFLLPTYSKDIHEQLNLYRKFERGEIDRAYLQPTLGTVRESLFLIKNEKIEEIRNKTVEELALQRELRKVVLIDKDKFVLNMYQIKLSKQDIEVMTFMDYSDDALAQIIKFQPDVITCEVVSNEGVLDGFDILRSIRKSGEMKKGGLLAHTRFVFLTNQGQSRDLKQALDMGADGYIIKASIMPEELLGLLNRVNKGNRRVVVMEPTELSRKSENRAV